MQFPLLIMIVIGLAIVVLVLIRQNTSAPIRAKQEPEETSSTEPKYKPPGFIRKFRMYHPIWYGLSWLVVGVGLLFGIENMFGIGALLDVGTISPETLDTLIAVVLVVLGIGLCVVVYWLGNGVVRFILICGVLAVAVTFAPNFFTSWKLVAFPNPCLENRIASVALPREETLANAADFSFAINPDDAPRIFVPPNQRAPSLGICRPANDGKITIEYIMHNGDSHRDTYNWMAYNSDYVAPSAPVKEIRFTPHQDNTAPFILKVIHARTTSEQFDYFLERLK